MTTTQRSAIDERIRAILDERSMLKHPFYQKWTAGTLEPERLQEYARQYYHFEVNFPRYLSAIHARTESPAIRQLLLENMWDEEYGKRNHPALWLEFAEAAGVPAEEVESATLRPETQALVDHFREKAFDAPVPEALATLFAYEGQVPSIAWEKLKALRELYGYTPDQFEFFSVHLVADVGHSDAEMKAIDELSDDDDAVAQAVEEACDLLNGFLDGCYAAIED